MNKFSLFSAKVGLFERKEDLTTVYSPAGLQRELAACTFLHECGFESCTVTASRSTPLRPSRSGTVKKIIFQDCPRSVVPHTMDNTLSRVDSGIQTTPYRPLDCARCEIRLLEVASGQYGDDMVVSLRHVRLLDKPVYPAASYVWGHSLSTRPCIVDGIPMIVTRNLFNFLLYLRDFTKPRTIWVDALCINQEDMAERAAQVRSMKAIYEGAVRIYGWLGLPHDNEEARSAVVMMRECNKYLREGLRDNNDDIMMVFSKITSDLGCFPHDAQSELGWAGIARICDSPFWRRAWIYQEVSTPTKISFWYGHHDFDDVLVNAVATMAINFAKLPGFPEDIAKSCGHGSGAYSMIDARNRRENGQKLSFAELMQEMRVADCTDLRDRVYCLLAHTSDVPAGRFNIDYQIDPMELFVDVARYLITESKGGLEIFRYVFMPTAESTQEAFRARFQPSLPSWVPDWRQKVYLDSAFGHFTMTADDGLPLYTPLSGPVRVRVESSQLHVQGLVMRDTEITLLTNIWDDYNRSWQAPLKWYNDLLVDFGSCPSVDMAIRRSMLGNRTFFKEDHHWVQYKYRRGGLLDWQVIEATSSVPDPSSPTRPAYMFADFYNVCYGRRLAVLDHRRIAVVPAGATIGDKIAAFQGGHSLYLLRPLHDDHFQFIGECYVDGWMNGEIAHEKAEGIVRTIRLV